MRKVTDLLPTEAILISSDADLKVLEEFEKAGIVWVNGGEKPTEWKPFPSWEFPDRILLYEKRISRGSPNRYIEYPATDFIPTEAEKVEVDDTVLLSEVRNKLTPIKNLITMLENGLLKGSVEMHDLVLKELEQSKINIAELTRNPETK